MTNDLVFKIRNLTCEYVAGTPVLKLKRLDLPKGKLIFVIGKSGIGKSTFIETLGLMNNTIVADQDTVVGFSGEAGQTVELKSSWDWANQKLSDFRRSYFSFIFQNTNLMPNFTSGENMIVSLLIKGKSQAEAKAEVLEVMEKLSLPPSVFDKKITEVSGGQRQRLAFVRAVTADFTVLFGDEPTGNLDEKTAHELMHVLKDLIVNRNKVGLIVSHDLNLAAHFADMIIPITAISKEDGTMMGEVLEENIISKTNGIWRKQGGTEIVETVSYLNQFLSTDHVSILK